MKVNQLGIALYDNKPILPANRWFEPNPNREDYKSRFNFEMNFLGDFAPQKLRCALIWPPSQLRRMDYWQRHKDIYEGWIQRAEEIKYDIRGNRIRSSLPPLIGIPNANTKFQGKKGMMFNWLMPVQPSIVIAVQEQTDVGRFWNITWHSENEQRVFVLDAGAETAQVINKKHAPSSTRLSRAYPSPGDINPDLFMNFVQARMGKKIDTEYEQFKQQVLELINMGSPISMAQANHMFAQHPDWEQQLLKEMGAV